jgi:GDP-mannose 4,6-dehydratase|tara:strand:+ start:2136 stop:3092 length:957 start_codon:yes stop_codon:yes gene_type:complete
LKILITGVSGFVGSYVVDYALSLPDVEIFGQKRWRSPLNNIKENLQKINLYDCDLIDTTSTLDMIKEIKPDRIFHLAAQSFVPYSFTAPKITLDTNIVGTLNLLEAVRRADIDPIVQICSSSEVYGQVEENEVPIKETNPLRPQSPYAVSKVTEDMLAYQYFISYGIKTIRTRAFTHSGARRGDVFVDSWFAKQIAQIEKQIIEPKIHVGNLESIRTFMDVKDTVRAYWLALEKCEPGEVYNIGGTETMTIKVMLDMLLEMSTVKDIEIFVDPELIRPSDVTRQIPSTEKFKKITGWEPEIPYKTTLQETLDYWRKIV